MPYINNNTPRGLCMPSASYVVQHNILCLYASLRYLPPWRSAASVHGIVGPKPCDLGLFFRAQHTCCADRVLDLIEGAYVLLTSLAHGPIGRGTAQGERHHYGLAGEERRPKCRRRWYPILWQHQDPCRHLSIAAEAHCLHRLYPIQFRSSVDQLGFPPVRS